MNCGVDGVAAEEKEVNEPGSDTATGAGDTNKFRILGGGHDCGEENWWLDGVLTLCWALKSMATTMIDWIQGPAAFFLLRFQFLSAVLKEHHP